MWRRWIVTAAALAVLQAGPAAAHALLDEAEPPVGGAVQGSPAEIRLHFNEQVEPTLSGIQLLAADGTGVELGKVGLDPADPAVLRVSVPKLAPGTYKVVWRAVATDTHVTEGDYTFTVAP